MIRQTTTHWLHPVFFIQRTSKSPEHKYNLLWSACDSTTWLIGLISKNFDWLSWLLPSPLSLLSSLLLSCLFFLSQTILGTMVRSMQRSLTHDSLECFADWINSTHNVLIFKLLTYSQPLHSCPFIMVFDHKIRRATLTVKTTACGVVPCSSLLV